MNNKTPYQERYLIPDAKTDAVNLQVQIEALKTQIKALQADITALKAVKK